MPPYNRNGKGRRNHTTAKGTNYDQNAGMLAESHRNNPGMAYGIKMIGNT